MRASQVAKLGSPSSLLGGGIDDPEAGSGRILVDVRAAGLNLLTLRSYRGFIISFLSDHSFRARRCPESFARWGLAFAASSRAIVFWSSSSMGLSPCSPWSSRKTRSAFSMASASPKQLRWALHTRRRTLHCARAPLGDPARQYLSAEPPGGSEWLASSLQRPLALVYSPRFATLNRRRSFGPVAQTPLSTSVGSNLREEVRAQVLAATDRAGANVALDPGEAQIKILDFRQEGAIRPPVTRTFTFDEFPDALEMIGQGRIHGKAAVAIKGIS